MTTPTPIIEALEPCHFCGKQPVRNGRGSVGGVLCGFDGKHRVQTYGATQAEADATWNTRASLKSPPIDLDPNGGAQSVTKIDAAREAIKAAYLAGAHAVHENYEAYREPDFGEAASDYAADVEDVIEAIAGVDLARCAIPPEGWYCTRSAGHTGPCAAMRTPSLPPEPACSSGEAEGDIRIAIWNAGMNGGMGQDLTQAFIRRAMDEPCMKRALAYLSQPVSGVEG